ETPAITIRPSDWTAMLLVPVEKRFVLTSPAVPKLGSRTPVELRSVRSSRASRCGARPYRRPGCPPRPERVLDCRRERWRHHVRSMMQLLFARRPAQRDAVSKYGVDQGGGQMPERGLPAHFCRGRKRSVLELNRSR